MSNESLNTYYNYISHHNTCIGFSIYQPRRSVDVLKVFEVRNNPAKGFRGLKRRPTAVYIIHIDDFICREIESRNTKFLGQMQDELKFLKWKAKVYADSVQPGDAIIIGLNDASKLFELSRKACHYTKVSIKQFTENAYVMAGIC